MQFEWLFFALLQALSKKTFFIRKESKKSLHFCIVDTNINNANFRFVDAYLNHIRVQTCRVELFQIQGEQVKRAYV